MNLESADAKRILSRSQALRGSVNLVGEISDPTPKMNSRLAPLQIMVNLVHPLQRRRELSKVS
jgi:hypothetical protein